MPRRQIEVDQRAYLYSLDDLVPLGARLWALLHARVRDELTGNPPLSTITLRTDLPHSSRRVMSGGLVGLVAVPRQVFQTLASKNYAVRLTVTAEGYISRQVIAVIPSDQRSIAAPVPVLNDTVMTLSDT